MRFLNSSAEVIQACDAEEHIQKSVAKMANMLGAVVVPRVLGLLRIYHSLTCT